MSDYDPHDVVEFFDERAAIKEFCGNVPRLNAESAALREVAERYGKDAAKMVQRHRENNQK